MQQKQLNLVEGPIIAKLIKLTTPLMATALIQMTYNFTDMIWLGKLGSQAVAAVGVVSFFSWIASEFAIVSKVGSSVNVAIQLGANKMAQVKNTIKTGGLILLFTALCYLVIVQLFAPQLLSFYNLEAPVFVLAKQYLRVIGLGFVFHFINFWISSIYHGLGDSLTPFKFNAIGLIINVILDPMLIFGFGVVPTMGVLGAAIATMFAQMVVSLLFVVNSMLTKNLLYSGMVEGVFDPISRKAILKVGIPAGLQGLTHALISTLLGRFMSQYGANPLAVFSVGALIESITWMTTEGFQNGIIAFVGQNYGAMKMKRLQNVIKTCMIVVASIGIVSTTVLISLRYPIFTIFLSDSPEIIEMGALYLLILGISQFFMAIEIGGAGVFNGLGETHIPSKISMLFNVVRIPLALLLMPYFQYAGIWMAMSISSIFKGIVLNLSLYYRVKQFGL